MSMISTGLTGLNAAQMGLLTTSHNIVNAGTPGYNRQQVIQASAVSQGTGAGFIGQGVNVSSVRRVYDDLLVSQGLQAQTQSSQLDSYYTQIRMIDNVMGDPNSGLSPALQSFFSGVQDVATNPESVPSRQGLLNSAEALVARFQGLSQRFSEIRDTLGEQISSSITEINALAQQIASLNFNIGKVEGAYGQPANDLMDQRGELLARLNKEIGTTVVKQTDGSINVFIGTGQALVVGASAMALTPTASSADPTRTMVGYVAGSRTSLIPDSSLQGGKLGGYLAFRSNTLDSAQNSLGRIAVGLAQTFNDQHRLGQDLTGVIGVDFFDVPLPNIVANTGNAAASTLTASISNVNALTTSDYEFSYDGTTYTLTRLSDNVTATSTTSPLITLDGISITAATINANESFIIQPTRNAARDIGMAISDTAKIAAAAPIRTGALLANTGIGQIGAGSVNGFNDTVVITFTSPTAFDVIDSTTGATLAKDMVYTSGANISFNGWTTLITNGVGPTTPVAGDTFTVDKTLTSTTSGTATIGGITLSSPPVDTFLTNGVKVVFDSATAFHLEGTTNNVTGVSSIAASAAGVTAVGLLVNGANTAGFTVATANTVTSTIGTGGAGAYTATGTRITVSGGTIAGVGGGTVTISGATVTVEGGSYTGSTTFKGVNITINEATGAISIPAAATGTIASTFHGRPATGLAYNSAISNLISVNGWTTELTGSPLAGDTFTISANTNASGDNRNTLLLGKLQTQNTLNGSTASYQSTYGQLVSQIGNKTRELEATSKAQMAMVTQIQQAQQSLSGVNLDEEAANLLRYQQAYQASGKVLQLASTLFDTLLNLGR